MTEPAPDIGHLYQKHAPAVYRRIRRFYRDQEAEEVLHEVFLVALERIEHFRGEASASTWLYRIATNHCLNRLRDQKRRDELWLESQDDLWYGRHTGAHQEAALTLQQLWRTLSAELVSVGIYYYLDGMTQGEIARVMGVSRRTVGNRLGELERVAKEAAQ